MERDMANWRHEAQYSKSFNPKRSSLGHSESRSQNQDKRILKTEKGKGSSQTRKSQKAISKFLSRSLAVQKRMGSIQSNQEKNLSTKYTLLSKAVLKMKDRKKLSPGNY